ncbi:hypothetical protein ATANTOWER_007439 [Ataeniobius toweri]|uniref:Uncharacterized protein n=1 Tax=Ataeniobius toweri TaxID=208326 RepID=A0ABU7BG87_9TELE|nr:hypothetical protein [Ataeniobius toweri]
MPNTEADQQSHTGVPAFRPKKNMERHMVLNPPTNPLCHIPHCRLRPQTGLDLQHVAQTRHQNPPSMEEGGILPTCPNPHHQQSTAAWTLTGKGHCLLLFLPLHPHWLS